jgi:hypothetical protein
VSRDPIGEQGGLNLYAYVDNDPVNLIDPLGLKFRWHGNWGGPGWANGGWNPESGPLPDPGDPDYVPPTDEQDACYEKHDRCIHDCPPCPKKVNSKCIEDCDHKLHRCLNKIKKKTCKSRLSSCLFGTVIPWLVH